MRDGLLGSSSSRCRAHLTPGAPPSSRRGRNAVPFCSPCQDALRPHLPATPHLSADGSCQNPAARARPACSLLTFGERPYPTRHPHFLLAFPAASFPSSRWHGAPHRIHAFSRFVVCLPTQRSAAGGRLCLGFRAESPNRPLPPAPVQEGPGVVPAAGGGPVTLLGPGAGPVRRPVGAQHLLEECVNGHRRPGPHLVGLGTLAWGDPHTSLGVLPHSGARRPETGWGFRPGQGSRWPKQWPVRRGLWVWPLTPLWGQVAVQPRAGPEHRGRVACLVPRSPERPVWASVSPTGGRPGPREVLREAAPGQPPRPSQAHLQVGGDPRGAPGSGLGGGGPGRSGLGVGLAQPDAGV